MTEWEGELKQKDSDTAIIEQLHLEQWQPVSYLGPERPEQEFKAHDYGFPLNMVKFRIRKLTEEKIIKRSTAKKIIEYIFMLTGAIIGGMLFMEFYK